MFGITACKDNSTDTYMVDCSFEKEIKDKNYVATEAEKSYIREYLAENDITATQHEKGFFYTIQEAGEDTKIERCYDVSVTYKCYTFDGKYIDFGTNVAYALYAETVIVGFRLGMTTVGNGGKVTIYLPPSLAYGEKGADPAIGPNEYLIFEITINDARKKITYY